MMVFMDVFIAPKRRGSRRAVGMVVVLLEVGDEVAKAPSSDDRAVKTSVTLVGKYRWPRFVYSWACDVRKTRQEGVDLDQDYSRSSSGES